MSGLPGNGRHAPIAFLNSEAYSAGSGSFQYVTTIVKLSNLCGGRISQRALLAPSDKRRHSRLFSIWTRFSRSASATASIALERSSALLAFSFNRADVAFKSEMVALKRSFAPIKATSDRASPTTSTMLAILPNLFRSGSDHSARISPMTPTKTSASPTYSAISHVTMRAFAEYFLRPPRVPRR